MWLLTWGSDLALKQLELSSSDITSGTSRMSSSMTCRFSAMSNKSLQMSATSFGMCLSWRASSPCRMCFWQIRNWGSVTGLALVSARANTFLSGVKKFAKFWTHASCPLVWMDFGRLDRTSKMAWLAVMCEVNTKKQASKTPVEAVILIKIMTWKSQEHVGIIRYLFSRVLRDSGQRFSPPAWRSTWLSPCPELQWGRPRHSRSTQSCKNKLQTRAMSLEHHLTAHPEEHVLPFVGSGTLVIMLRPLK